MIPYPFPYFQLRTVADMFFYNVRNRCSEEYDD